MRRALGILMAAVSVAVAACGGGGDDAAQTTTTAEPITTTTTAAPTTTTTEATTTTTVPPQAALVLCSGDTLVLRTVGTTTGQDLATTPVHTDAFDAVQHVYFNGEQGGRALCQPDVEREVFNLDFTRATGVSSYTDDTVSVAIYDFTTGALQRATAPGEISDFGNTRPEAQAATFTPTGGLYWKETYPGGPESCRSFRAEGNVTYPIQREGIERYQVGVGGSCHGAGNQHVVWDGDNPLTCYSQLGCDDVNGNEPPDKPYTNEKVTGPGSSSDLPNSERFQVADAYNVVEEGLTYFIATDDTGVYLYSWNPTTKSEPKQVAPLGLGRWTIIAYVPKK